MDGETLQIDFPGWRTLPTLTPGQPGLIAARTGKVEPLNPASGVWEFREGRVDTACNVVIVELTGFSQYTLPEYIREFADVPAGHRARVDIQLLAARHIVLGTSETELSPFGIVTRAQFAALLGRALRLPAAEGAYTDGSNIADFG